MEAWLIGIMETLPTWGLVLIAAVSLYTLSKGADLLVDEAVGISLRLGVPKVIIGATIVSLGTTLPEATVSVFAAIKGNPDLALGNAIGSIICDTGLILGLAAIIGVLPVKRSVMNRQGRIQIGAAFMLAILALPFLGRNGEGVIRQWIGFVFLGMLVAYILMTIHWAKQKNNNKKKGDAEVGGSLFWLFVKLAFGVTVVIVSSKVLIPSVEITAVRIGIPQSIIAATIVAFGTSLPELMTAVASVRKGHAALAVGNIVGADILNVLFVVGAAAAVTPGGLRVPVNFYYLQIPTMLIVLVAFRLFAKSKDQVISKKEGISLLAVYVIYIVINYTVMV